MKSNNPLWTKDFTILTLGSLVSMLGNALVSFAMCLMVLDTTDSSLLYAIFIGAYTLPQIIVPIFSGALLDRYSRKKMIYTLDFISTALYISAAIIIGNNWFSFTLLAIYCFVIGTVHSIYIVAYQSFYPLLVSEGNLSKAYSVSSVLETLSAVMVPVATFLYKWIGMEPLLWINVGCFFLAAVVETQIKTDEHYIEQQRQIQREDRSVKRLWNDILEGFRYLKVEKGLIAIAMCFTLQTLLAGAQTVVALPFFKANYHNGEYLFMIVCGMTIVGRAISGIMHYNVKVPTHKKYRVCLIACVIAAVLESFYLFIPVPFAMIVCFCAGMALTTSYTIRSSATQNYVPDIKKGRFNGALNMMSTTGNLVGELIAGALAMFIPSRFVLMGLMLLNALFMVVLLQSNKKSVKSIYNTPD